MPSQVFRKIAIERQSSPERLDLLPQLTSPLGWLALAAAGGLLLGALIWGFAGRVPSTASGAGALARDGERVAAVLYFPAGKAGMIRAGMDAELTLRGVERAEFGFLRGRVAAVAEEPSAEADIARRLRSEGLARAAAAEGPCVEVLVDLLPDPSEPSGYSWSSSRGPAMRLFPGAAVSASVILSYQRPISLALPFLPAGGAGVER